MKTTLLSTKNKGSAVETRLISDPSAGKIHIAHTQDVEPILDAVKMAPDIFKRNQPGRMGRYAGSIPLVVAQEWAKEWGVKLFSTEFKKLARKRLDDPNFKYLRVDYK